MPAPSREPILMEGLVIWLTSRPPELRPVPPMMTRAVPPSLLARKMMPPPLPLPASA